MMNKIVMILMPIVAITVAAKTQDVLTDIPAKNHRILTGTGLNKDFKTALKIEAFLGLSASLASGGFIDYQKTFHNAFEAGTEFKGNIQPVFMATFGAQARYMPFSSGVFRNAGVSFGLHYLQKGFANLFEIDHQAAEGYSDITTYKEIYRHRYLAAPLQIRWGGKWFATIGASFNRHINSTKTQRLDRKQSGAGAINGGFSTRTKDEKAIEKSMIKKSNTDLIIGGGCPLNDRITISLQVNIGGKVLNNTVENFRSSIIQIFFSKSFQLAKS
jgi:hypothetical protein